MLQRDTVLFDQWLVLVNSHVSGTRDDVTLCRFWYLTIGDKQPEPCLEIMLIIESERENTKVFELQKEMYVTHLDNKRTQITTDLSVWRNLKKNVK